jgi:integrase
MSVEVESKVLGRWHHPKIGKGKDGRSIFLPTKEYVELVRDKNFKLWYDHYRGMSSRGIANVTVYRMMKAGNLASPSEFLSLGIVEAKGIIRNVCNGLIAKGHGVGARQTMIFAKGFYNYFNEDLGKTLKFKRDEYPKAVSKKAAIESIPHNSDIYRLSQVALGMKYRDNEKNKLLGLRNAAIILFLWQSGIRVNALSKLKYSHIKDYVEGKLSLTLLKEQFKEANIEDWESMGLRPMDLPPLFLMVTPDLDTKLSKYGLAYYVTFIHQSAFKALKEWLDARTEATQKPLKPNDYVFVAFDFSANTIGEKPLNPQLVNHMVKVVSGRAGMNGERIWVHLLRKAFAKVLRTSPSMDDETKEALMGHKLPGSQGNYFDYHDIILVAKLYNECDWGSGTAGITKKLADQQETINTLQVKTLTDNDKFTALEKQLEQQMLVLEIIKTFLTEEQLQKLQLEKLHKDYEKEREKTKEEQPSRTDY